MDQAIRVLVIDRSHLARRLVSVVLEKLGLYEVISVDNAEKAWAVLHGDRQIKLVIMTLNLPGAPDGVDLVRSIRRHYSSKQLPIMVMSSNNDKEVVESAIQAGINDYLFKPVFPDVLEEHLARLLKRPASVGAFSG